VSEGFLLDTHALLWAVYSPEKLSASARKVLSTADRIHVSAVSAYEISLKYNLGKLDHAESLARGFLKEIAIPAFGVIDLTAQHAQTAGLLPTVHRDPFDRFLIAQAQIEQLTLISNETLFDSMAVIRLW
jgi:PIN domain nuclease of toxin-antitoxin system